MHVTDARKAGESERRMATVSAWRETPFFSDPRARRTGMDRIADAGIAKTTCRMQCGKQSARISTDAELVELTLLITSINTWNRFAIAFRKMPV